MSTRCSPPRSQRWRAVDERLEAPLVALRELVLAGGKRLRPAFCFCAFVGAGGAQRRSARRRRGRRPRAPAHVRTRARRRDGRVVDAPRPRRGARTIHPRPRPWRLARRAAPLRRGHGDPRRRLRVHLRRSADARPRRRPRSTSTTSCASSCVSASRSTSSAPRCAAPTSTIARRIATYKSAKYTVERPLHLGAALAGRASRARAGAQRDRAPARRGVPAPRRPARRVRRGARSRASPSATTCARASRRRCSRSRRAAPTPTVAASSNGSAPAISTPPRSVRSRQLFVRRGARRRGRGRRSTGSSTEARRALGGRAAHAEPRRTLLDELAVYVAWRDH